MLFFQKCENLLFGPGGKTSWNPRRTGSGTGVGTHPDRHQRFSRVWINNCTMIVFLTYCKLLNNFRKLKISTARFQCHSAAAAASASNKALMDRSRRSPKQMYSSCKSLWGEDISALPMGTVTEVHRPIKRGMGNFRQVFRTMPKNGGDATPFEEEPLCGVKIYKIGRGRNNGFVYDNSF